MLGCILYLHFQMLPGESCYWCTLNMVLGFLTSPGYHEPHAQVELLRFILRFKPQEKKNSPASSGHHYPHNFFAPFAAFDDFTLYLCSLFTRRHTTFLLYTLPLSALFRVSHKFSFCSPLFPWKSTHIDTNTQTNFLLVTYVLCSARWWKKSQMCLLCHYLLLFGLFRFLRFSRQFPTGALCNCFRERGRLPNRKMRKINNSTNCFYFLFITNIVSSGTTPSTSSLFSFLSLHYFSRLCLLTLWAFPSKKVSFTMENLKDLLLHCQLKSPWNHTRDPHT